MLNRLLDMIDRPFEVLANPLLLAARLVIVPYYLPEGYDKIVQYSDTAKFMESHGVSTLFLPLVILLEIFGSIFLAVGFLTRLTCLALAVFTIAADLIFNKGAAAETGQLLFQAEITIVAAFLALMAVGAGGWSVDAWRKKAEAK